MGIKYEKGIEGDDGWSAWHTPVNLEEHEIACCDCGLVHTFQFQPIVITKRAGSELTVTDLPSETDSGEQISIMFRAKRNNRATGQKRRKR